MLLEGKKAFVWGSNLKLYSMFKGFDDPKSTTHRWQSGTAATPYHTTPVLGLSFREARAAQMQEHVVIV